jgi:hypothetical protein
LPLPLIELLCGDLATFEWESTDEVNKKKTARKGAAETMPLCWNESVEMKHEKIELRKR